ncbi:MAG: Zn-ribbon-containing protein [Gammaproteobacteria bacterium]|nr:Zn-ribbon-containing protein [Gammaproteobacteria bacterium]MBU1555871.1 Zn-ribbon-containing protein [Gammaproteobacteria bacterium]MBU2071463.1 Zn-ribbon-containing protein [Gammaproteobacteria bacterium]MBU2182475.1 Zn-ribbon-containing protein [Gammaproteobacteria bacterium]MBU2205857.1 Zn-ribbon-containing protein [Gammaproteobacteria bacterium]
MYLAELTFKIIADTSLDRAEAAIRNYVEALIFNGQSLGREFPTAWQQHSFVCRLVLPAENALQQSCHSPRGLQAQQQLAAAGLAYPQVRILGMDLMSQHSDPCQQSEFYILYSRFSDTCSPLRCGADLAPVPLYQLRTADPDHEALLRWQLQYQALDEIQMQQSRVLHKTAERSMQQLHSELNRQGRRLARRLAADNNIAVYYALYSGSSSDCTADTNKSCPGCGGNWRLAEPLLQLFDFKCDSCFLVSNIAWDCQSPSAEQGAS